MKYALIVFIQYSEDVIEPEKILEEQGNDGLFKYLKQWDYGEYWETQDIPFYGKDDNVFYYDNYILSYNSRIPYFGLEIMIDED